MACGRDTAASVNIYIMSGASVIGQLRTASGGTLVVELVEESLEALESGSR